MAVAFQHHKTCFLIGQPAQSCQGHKPVGTDYNQSPKTMADTGKTKVPPILPNAIRNHQMTTINADLYPVPEEGYDSVAGYD
jgi:hypothetical protein